MPKEVTSYMCIHCSKLHTGPDAAAVCENSHVDLVSIANKISVKIKCGPYQGMYYKDNIKEVVKERADTNDDNLPTGTVRLPA